MTTWHQIFTVRVDGIAKAQPRARAFKRGDHASVYNPPTADGWKASVATAVAPWRPREPYACPIAMSIDFYLPRPARLKNKVLALWQTSKPDFDNLAKAVADAMTGIVWHDDAQVCVAVIRKMYAPIGDVPHAQITVCITENP